MHRFMPPLGSFWAWQLPTCGDNFARLIQDALEIPNGLLKSIANLDLGGPVDLLLGQTNVWLALRGSSVDLGSSLISLLDLVISLM